MSVADKGSLIPPQPDKPSTPISKAPQLKTPQLRVGGWTQDLWNLLLVGRGSGKKAGRGCQTPVPPG